MNKKRKKYFIIVILLVIVSVACIAIYLHVANKTPFDGITFDTSYEELADKFALQGKKGDEYMYTTAKFCGLNGKLQIIIWNGTKVANMNWYFDLEKGKDFNDYKDAINQIIKKINFKNGGHASHESENNFVWKDKSDSVIYELEECDTDEDKQLIARYYPK